MQMVQWRRSFKELFVVALMGWLIGETFCFGGTVSEICVSQDRPDEAAIYSAEAPYSPSLIEIAALATPRITLPFSFGNSGRHYFVTPAQGEQFCSRTSINVNAEDLFQTSHTSLRRHLFFCRLLI